MPLPPSRPRSGPRRRTLLASAAGTAAALLAACSAGSSPGGSAARRTPTADQRALSRAAADSAGLAALYDAVLAVHPGLQARLTPLRDTVRRHAEVLAERAGPAAPSPSASAPSPSPSAPVPSPSAPAPSASAPGAAAPSASRPAVPGEEKQALRLVADAERDLAGRRGRELSGLGGEPARLLASVAAAGAVHVYLLEDD
ncbi:hypothetical protein [Streptomyces fragilis]|uniref:Lipoprotein n=1 Tax=Streptomyces fragilis TaxID=67301 RepID=A0ABV2YPX7_9ACTN|nr:hypothetical protein [Streptomyces fragilis]